ncbi:MAG: SDR family NAD(P)-dependent oxidoreductase, partial [Fischerella sp.]|nr:SDR family NAD(P)-dependent oxidoreductase [Fischerella sp.]
LRNEDSPDSIVMQNADTLFEGSIPRQKVAQVCVEALFEPAAQNKIVEIVAKPDAPAKNFSELFASVA